LKNADLLNYRWVESSGGPPRKYFSLTEKGSAFYQLLENTWREMADGVERVINSQGQGNSEAQGTSNEGRGDSQGQGISDEGQGYSEAQGTSNEAQDGESIDNPQPTTDNPQPASHNPQPTTDNSQPATNN
jgi:hypothetical protein